MRKTVPQLCPYCGQPLSVEAAARLRRAEAELDRRIQQQAGELVRPLLEKAHRKWQREQREKKTRRERVLEQEVERLKADSERQKTEAERLRRKLDQVEPGERGDLYQRDVTEELKQAFAALGDRIESVPRGAAGTDVIHKIHHRDGRAEALVGTIIYECKDTAHWKPEFVRQVRSQGEKYKTAYLVLVTRALPGKGRDVAYKEGIVVVRPSGALAVARVLRHAVIAIHKARLSECQ
mgnify:CR=1 FL=1